MVVQSQLNTRFVCHTETHLIKKENILVVTDVVQYLLGPPATINFGVRIGVIIRVIELWIRLEFYLGLGLGWSSLYKCNGRGWVDTVETKAKYHTLNHLI